MRDYKSNVVKFPHPKRGPHYVYRAASGYLIVDDYPIEQHRQTMQDAAREAYRLFIK